MPEMHADYTQTIAACMTSQGNMVSDIKKIGAELFCIKWRKIETLKLFLFMFNLFRETTTLFQPLLM